MVHLKLSLLGGIIINIDNTTVKIVAKVSSDASGSGYFVVNLDRHIKFKSAPFSENDSLKSLTWRELFALHQTYTDEVICLKMYGLTVANILLRVLSFSLCSLRFLWLLVPLNSWSLKKYKGLL